MKTAFIQKNHFLHSRRCTTASFLVPLWIKKDYEIYVFLLKKKKRPAERRHKSCLFLFCCLLSFHTSCSRYLGCTSKLTLSWLHCLQGEKNQRKQAPLIVLKLLHLTYRIHFFILVRSRSCSKPHILMTKPSHADIATPQFDCLS